MKDRRILIIDINSDTREMKTLSEFAADFAIIAGNENAHIFYEAKTFHVEHSTRVGKGERKRNRKDRWK